MLNLADPRGPVSLVEDPRRRVGLVGMELVISHPSASIRWRLPAIGAPWCSPGIGSWGRGRVYGDFA